MRPPGSAASSIGLVAALLMFSPATPMAAGSVVLSATAGADPYRYLHTAQGTTTTGAPAAVDRAVDLGGATTTPPVDEKTGETLPQAELAAGSGVFVVPKGATSIHISIAAVDDPVQLPTDGRIDGNVYHFEVTAGFAALALASGQRVTITLRAPAGSRDLSIEMFDATAPRPWSRLVTHRSAVDQDRYSAEADALGEFALVEARTAAKQAGDESDGGGGGGPAIAVLASVLALSAIVAVPLVRKRFRSTSR